MTDNFADIRQELHDQISRIENIADVRDVLVEIADILFDLIIEDIDDDGSYYESDEWKQILAEEERIREAGMVDGVHYTELMGRIEPLEIENKFDEAVDLLLRIIDAVEAESTAEGDTGVGVEPSYYVRLATVYRKQRRYADEVSILERYAKQPTGGRSRLLLCRIANPPA